MQVYEGKGKDLEEDENIPGLGAHVVMKMIKVLETPEAHKVYFDNFFTGFALMRHLREVDVRAAETVCANRMNKCPIEEDKQLKKETEVAVITGLILRMKFWPLLGMTTTVSNFYQTMMF